MPGHLEYFQLQQLLLLCLKQFITIDSLHIHYDILELLILKDYFMKLTFILRLTHHLTDRNIVFVLTHAANLHLRSDNGFLKLLKNAQKLFLDHISRLHMLNGLVARDQQLPVKCSKLVDDADPVYENHYLERGADHQEVILFRRHIVELSSMEIEIVVIVLWLFRWRLPWFFIFNECALEAIPPMSFDNPHPKQNDVQNLVHYLWHFNEKVVGNLLIY